MVSEVSDKADFDDNKPSVVVHELKVDPSALSDSDPSN